MRKQITFPTVFAGQASGKLVLRRAGNGKALSVRQTSEGGGLVSDIEYTPGEIRRLRKFLNAIIGPDKRAF